MPLTRRPRRLRTTPAMRGLVRETRVHPGQLMLPVFVRDGITQPVPIASMPGVVQHTVDSLRRAAAEAAAAGIGGLMLFGIPRDEDKDSSGSAALAGDGIIARGLRAIADEVGDALVIGADTCLDEFTDHGHCGPLTRDGRVNNDESVALYGQLAVLQAESGAHLVAPSGAMDGQVAGIREALDDARLTDTAIMAYAAKYASSYFGPFREAVSSSLTGDRRTYQQDYANGREGVLESLLDEAEGADIVMVKPAGSYLDVVARVRDAVDFPVAAYQVSGEYAMICAAAEREWISRQGVLVESVVGIVRAGASIVLTYGAIELAGYLR